MSIVFQKDWKNEDGRLRAIPHMSTKNTSFLRTAQLLRRMGINNYAFSLCLYDPDLLDVDVHDLEENTPENEIIRTKVQIEARRNGWYYLRECIRIYEQGGTPVRFRLDRGACAMTWCFLNGIDYTGMQPRQTGKAQPLDAKILSEDGWIEMGEVTENTKVITPDGEIVSVIGIYPQGLKDIYRITLEGGQTTRCCDEHLWYVYCKEWVNPWKIITLKDIRLSGDEIYFPVGGSLEKLVSIDYVGQHKAQCISIDHPDHLYITDDYIVTHNTVAALSLTSWVIYSSGLDFQVGMLAKDNSLRQENVKRVKSFGENLPSWWVVEDRYKDKKNAEEIYYSALKTHYVTFVGQSEKSAADKQARGASPPVFHFDEFEYTNNIGISYPTILASTGTARENAKRNGKPHSNIITTTAGNPTKPECQEAARILDGAMPFTERLYDIENSEILHQVVKAASPQKMIIGVFSHLQLGKDNDWLRDKISRNKMTPDQVLRDYLNRRVSIQDNPVIPKNVLSLINSSEREPSYIQILSNKFVIYWYLPKEVVHSQAFKERSIVVGCDSSEMIGRDSTTLIGIDPRSLETVCSFRCSEGNINVVGVMIAQLLLMFPKMVLVPENKSSGTAIIDNVSLILRKEGHNPFYRMFNWVVNNCHEQPFSQINTRDHSLLDTVTKRYFGIKTDKSKREELYSSILLEASTKAASRIKDKILIQELGSLTVRNGRVDHAVGGHDDTVVAWLMAMWFILNGKHLDMYGIKPGTVLSHINPGQPDKTVLTAERQSVIRDKIEDLEKALKTQRDPSVRKLLEADLTLFKSMITNGPIPIPTTADELNRDPRRFTDSDIAEQSRNPVKSDEVERSLRMLLRL